MMTKKLQKMLKKPRAKKKKRVAPRDRKPSRRERLAIRGIVMKLGYKKSMVLMCEFITEQGRSVPAVYLSHKDPAPAFLISMYYEIGKWDSDHCRRYIYAVTGEQPEFTEPGAMQGTIKAILHAFFDEDATSEDVNKYDSAFKMWPNVRSKLPKKNRRKEMATGKGKKAKGKKATKKKAPSKRVEKKSAKKKAPAKKGKKSTAKSSGRLSSVTSDTKLLKKKASCGESEAWDEVLACMPKKAITFAKLCEVVDKKLEGDEGYTRRIVGSLRRRGCISAVD